MGINKDHLPKKPRLNKLPANVKTISDLLARDDVSGIIKDLAKNKEHIKDLIVISIDRRTDKYAWSITDDTLVSTAVWLLENAKLDLLQPTNDEG